MNNCNDTNKSVLFIGSKDITTTIIVISNLNSNAVSDSKEMYRH